MNAAWSAWKAATKFLFWTLVETVTRAIALRKQAERELSVLHPRKPADMYAAGYALFIYELTFDEWHGHWRDPKEMPGLLPKRQYSCADWALVPWHKVEFSETKHFQFEVRAVPKKYADRHLQGLQWKAAA